MTKPARPMALYRKNISFAMLGIILILSACIPREDPPERTLLSHDVDLPAVLTENSGLTESGGLIWFMNDGGNAPALYGYNFASDTVERTVIVRDAINTDWEDITQNGQKIFIGDFGNNASGNRTDLRVYIINKNDLLADADTVTPSGIIYFSYEDQTDFTPVAENTSPFDCEALIATEDSVYLFTKDWLDQHTRLYVLSTEPGTQIARFRQQWNVSGLITSAAWSSETQQLYLLGYTPAYPFVWVYTNFSPEDLTFETSHRTDFTGLWGTQTEGIMISADGVVRVSSETSTYNKASLYRFEIVN
jgi:hypothetical protein